MIHSVAIDVHLPAGIAGPEPMDFDVRCFLVEHRTGLVLVDTGLPDSEPALTRALEKAGATWSEVSDIVLTHHHPDHVGGLARVRAFAPQAVVWASPHDRYEGSVRAMTNGTTLHGLRALETPGHTPGHLSLLHESDGVLLVGDCLGTRNGQLIRPPEPFTTDAARAEVSLRRLAALNCEAMLFSHGEPIDRPTAALDALLAAS